MSSKDTLASDLKDAFKNSSDDSEMCSKIAKAIKKFAESGTVSINVTGTVASGVYTGTGSGHLSLTDSLMSTPLLLVCNTMYANAGVSSYDGNKAYKDGIGDSLDAMSNASNTISINTSGTTVPPPPASGTVPPSSGPAKGKITCNSTNLKKGLSDIFDYMYDHAQDEGFDGDDYFSSEASDLIETYYTSGVIAVSGTEAISGTAGSGSISFS